MHPTRHTNAYVRTPCHAEPIHTPHPPINHMNTNGWAVGLETFFPRWSALTEWVFNLLPDVVRTSASLERGRNDACAHTPPLAPKAARGRGMFTGIRLWGAGTTAGARWWCVQPCTVCHFCPVLWRYKYGRPIKTGHQCQQLSIVRPLVPPPFSFHFCFGFCVSWDAGGLCRNRPRALLKAARHGSFLGLRFAAFGQAVLIGGMARSTRGIPRKGAMPRRMPCRPLQLHSRTTPHVLGSMVALESRPRFSGYATIYPDNI